MLCTQMHAKNKRAIQNGSKGSSKVVRDSCGRIGSVKVMFKKQNVQGKSKALSR